MDLASYVEDMGRRASLAAAVCKSPDYLWQIGAGKRRASTDLAQAIHDATDGRVSRAELRPDVWGRR
jgi:DNA-binding transcriptional regulator YdaS (Cro superfamily)